MFSMRLFGYRRSLLEIFAIKRIKPGLRAAEIANFSLGNLLENVVISSVTFREENYSRILIYTYARLSQVS